MLSQAPIKAAIDNAAALCAPPLSCDGFTEFQGLMDAVTVECCDELTDCSSGYPTTCTPRCAAMLLPVQAACVDVLSNRLYAPIKAAIANTAAQCAKDGH